MTTLEDMRQRVRQQILGYSRDQQQVSVLSADMGATDTSFQLDTSTMTSISRGLVEIDDELILVKQLDTTDGTVQIMGGLSGRGFEGSVAAAHSTGALVTMSPLMPRVGITQAINDTIRDMYPDLPVVKATEIIKLAPVFEYELPAEAVGVHYITMQTIGPSQIWYPGPRWRYNPMADPTAFPSGKSVQLMDDVVPGRAMRIVYLVEPEGLVNPTDVYETVTGYPSSSVDCVVWGALSRLVISYETARLQAQTIEGTERDNLIPAKVALQTADYYRQRYEDSIDQERQRFFDETPNFAFWQGG